MATQRCDVVVQTLQSQNVEMPVRNVVDRAVQTELDRNISNASELSNVRSCLCVDRRYIVQVRIKVSDSASREDAAAAVAAAAAADGGNPPCCFPQLGLCGKRSKEQVGIGPSYILIMNFQHSSTFLRVLDDSRALVRIIDDSFGFFVIESGFL